VEIGYKIVYVLEMAVIYCKHFRSYPCEIMKWKFEERRFQILMFQVSYLVCLVTHCKHSAKCISDSYVL